MNELYIEYFEKEAELAMKEAYHEFLSEYASNDILMMESVFTESSNILDKAKDTIRKIIDAIKNFFSNAIKTISDIFTKKDAEKKLEELEKADIPASQKVTIVSSDKDKELLNNYIKEMVKIERELMAIKGTIKGNMIIGDKDLAMLEYQKVSKKIDDLNAEYDKKFLKDNQETIELAAKDAIRFSKKQLNNIKVDFKALEDEHTKILKEFEKDADGCDVPIKHNILVKMANSLGTRMRKVEASLVKCRKINVLAALAISFAAGAVVKAAEKSTGSALSKIGDAYMKKHPEILEKIQKATD